MIIVQTNRLILRTFNKSDFTSMYKINQDPKVMEYFPEIPDEEKTRLFIERIMVHQNQYGYSLYAVELNSTGDMIGFVGLLRPSFEAHFTPAVEIGWRLASQHWNQGYATEGAKAVLDYAFSTLQLDEVVSFTSEQNKVSRRVMQKIGLTHNQEDDFNHPLLPSSHPLSRHVLYRLNRKNYAKAFSSAL